MSKYYTINGNNYDVSDGRNLFRRIDKEMKKIDTAMVFEVKELELANMRNERTKLNRFLEDTLRNRPEFFI